MLTENNKCARHHKYTENCFGCIPAEMMRLRDENRIMKEAVRVADTVLEGMEIGPSPYTLMKFRMAAKNARADISRVLAGYDLGEMDTNIPRNALKSLET